MSPVGHKIPVLFAHDDIPAYERLRRRLKRTPVSSRLTDLLDHMHRWPHGAGPMLLPVMREHLSGTRRAILLASADARRVGGDGWSVLHWALAVLQANEAVFTIVNADGSRDGHEENIPHMMRGEDTHRIYSQPQASAIEEALARRLPPRSLPQEG